VYQKAIKLIDLCRYFGTFTGRSAVKLSSLSTINRLQIRLLVADYSERGCSICRESYKARTR